jgi:nucleoside phosphorylase
MATQGERYQTLRDFFVDSFRSSDLEMFLILNGYEEVASAVNQHVGGSRYAFEVVRELDQRGLINARFFECLKQARSAKAARIKILIELWLDQDQTSSKPADSTTPSSPPETGRTAPAGRADVGNVIALPEEFGYFFEEIEAARTDVKDEDSGSYDYFFDRPCPRTRPYRCVASLVGEMGQSKAGLLTQRQIARWEPRTVVVIGIAGGISGDVVVGDVVVGTQIDAYLENSKAVPGTDGREFTFELAGEVYCASGDLIRAALHLRFAHRTLFRNWCADGNAELDALIPEAERTALVKRRALRKEPNYFEGAVASGPTVGAARQFVDWVRTRNRKFLALEMESAGVLAAVYEKADPARSLVLRGISDYGDERKAQLDGVRGGGLRRYAMRNAIRLLWRLLEAGELPQHDLRAAR